MSGHEQPESARRAPLTGRLAREYELAVMRHTHDGDVFTLSNGSHFLVVECECGIKVVARRAAFPRHLAARLDTAMTGPAEPVSA